MKEKILKLGVVANEFFDESVGRLGGFGWAAKQVASLFNNNPKYGVKVIFLSCEFNAEHKKNHLDIDGTKLIPLMNDKFVYWRSIWSEKIDLLLCIDFRPSYNGVFQGLPRTPVIIWVRDPRTSEDASRLLTIRIPGQEDNVPQTVKSFNCKSFNRNLIWSRCLRRPIFFATPAPFLIHKISDTYGMRRTQVSILPNIIDLEPGEIRKSKKPSVVFLGRLDPYKRPWVATELARDFPEVDFFFCGKRHVFGRGAWEPRDLSNNVHLLGHVGD